MKGPTKDRPLNVRVPSSLFELVDAEAGRREVPRSVVVRDALVENLEQRGLWPVDEATVRATVLEGAK